MARQGGFAGPLPWNRQKQRFDNQAGWQFKWGTSAGGVKGKREKGIVGNRSAGYGPHSTGGWVRREPSEYQKNPDHPEMVEMHLYNGRKSRVPVGDVEEFMSFHKLKPEDVTGEMADAVHAAFAQSGGRKGYYVATPRGGHINNIRYNPSEQIMEATFWNGDTVVLFRVPVDIYVELERHAESGATQMGVDGQPRHLVGIRFWDLVRIRGSRTGARYPFTYASADSITAGANAAVVDTHDFRGAINDFQTLQSLEEATTSHRDAETKDKERDIQEAEQEAIKTFTDLHPEPSMAMWRNQAKKGLDLARKKFGADSNQYQSYKRAFEMGDINKVNRLTTEYKLWG